MKRAALRTPEGIAGLPLASTHFLTALLHRTMGATSRRGCRARPVAGDPRQSPGAGSPGRPCGDGSARRAALLGGRQCGARERVDGGARDGRPDTCGRTIRTSWCCSATCDRRRRSGPGRCASAAGTIAQPRPRLARPLPCETGSACRDLSAIEAYATTATIKQASQSLRRTSLAAYQPVFDTMTTCRERHHIRTAGNRMATGRGRGNCRSCAIRMWISSLGPSILTRAGLDALAQTFAWQGDRQRARGLYLRALTIRERELDVDHPDVAWTLVTWRTAVARLRLEDVSRSSIDAPLPSTAAGASATNPTTWREYVLRGNHRPATRRVQDARSASPRRSDAPEIFGPSHPLWRRLAQISEFVDLAWVSTRKRCRRHSKRSAWAVATSGKPCVYCRNAGAAYAARLPRGLDVAFSALAGNRPSTPSTALDALIQSRGVLLDEFAARARDGRRGSRLSG